MAIGAAIRGFGRALRKAKKPTMVKVKPLAERKMDPYKGRTQAKKQLIKSQQSINKSSMYIDGPRSKLLEGSSMSPKKEIEKAQSMRKEKRKDIKSAGKVIAGGAAAVGGIKLASEKGPKPVRKFLKSEPKFVNGKLKLVSKEKKKNGK